MPKGFSGVNDLHIQNSLRKSELSTQSGNTEQTSTSTTPQKADFVTYEDSPSMPGLWQSQDHGTSWEDDDHVFVLQYRPCSQEKVMEHIIKGGSPIGSLAENETNLRYWWILCVYYKLGKGPSSNDPVRWPILIITLEQANLTFFAKIAGNTLAELDCDASGWDPPVMCAFLPGGKHVNIKVIEPLLKIEKVFPDTLPDSSKKQMEEIIEKLFLDVACNYIKTAKQPIRIGNMYDGFCSVYNDKIPSAKKQELLNQKNSSGCLGVLLFFPLFALLALIKGLIS